MIVRVEHALRFRAVNDLLKEAGYVVFGRPISRPDQIYARFVVACNIIGEMMSVYPYRVYQSILVRVYRITHGVPHTASNSRYVRAGEHQDAEQLHVFCPCCGADLLTAGPPTFDEIKAELQARTSQKSPHSAVDEVENIQCEGKKKEGKRKARGGKGTGGGDLAGRG